MTLSQIAQFLSANLSEIERLNGGLKQNPSFIDVGWVLFAPMEMTGIQARKQGAILYAPVCTLSLNEKIPPNTCIYHIQLF